MKSDYPKSLRAGTTELQRGSEVWREKVARNIENFVGLAKVPVGLAGPLEIRGEAIDGRIWVPLATTEGTLVASTSRGMKVLNEAGGVSTRITRTASIQRAPVFEFASLGDAMCFASELENDWKWLVPEAEKTTSHGRLVDLKSFVLGRHVHVRFSMHAGEAAGQNMVSIAVASCVKALVSRYPTIERALLEGGFSGEKVPSNLNILLGRGRGVAASASIPGSILRQITRAEPEHLVSLHQIYSNSGFWAGTKNSHASLINLLPALFIATGQDVASVPESCMAQNAMHYHVEQDILRWEVVCPNIVCATIGGGTHLPTQKECLELMCCESADAFAEICAATALANEISFWAAICASEWVSAHAKTRKR